MGFSDFYGNSEAVRQIRDMLARSRFPQAVIAGPAGSGKYTLALMLAKAMNCLAPLSRVACLIFAASVPIASVSHRRKILRPALPRPLKHARVCAKPTRKRPDFSSRLIPMCW